jgi:hypothetical protein
MLADPQKREALISLYRSALPLETFNDPRRLIYEEMLRKDDVQLIKAVETSSRMFAQEIAIRRLYCLTPFPDSILMWSHYADNHRGICLEFGKDNPLIEMARPVRYRDTYPEWTLLRPGDGPLELVLTKSKDWAYEREFRIMGSVLDGPTRIDGNYVALPDGAVTAIVLGCQNTAKEEVRDIIKEHAPGLPIKRAVRIPNEYRLRIVED